MLRVPLAREVFEDLGCLVCKGAQFRLERGGGARVEECPRPPNVIGGLLARDEPENPAKERAEEPARESSELCLRRQLTQGALELAEAVALAAGRDLTVEAGAVAALDADEFGFRLAWLRAPA